MPLACGFLHDERGTIELQRVAAFINDLRNAAVGYVMRKISRRFASDFESIQFARRRSTVPIKCIDAGYKTPGTITTWSSPQVETSFDAKRCVIST